MRPGLLQDWVARQALVRPHALAVVAEHEKVTYEQLDEFSNQIGALLSQTGCRRGDRVCLLMPKSEIAVAALLGIYKADCVYVPLDPDSPAARLASVVSDCDCRVVIAAEGLSEKLRQVLSLNKGHTCDVLWLDSITPAGNMPRNEFTLIDVCDSPRSALDYRNTSADTAHILYTSGSTGKPKGVVITHANVISFITWATGYFNITAQDRLSGHSPLHFDLSFFDLFGAFAAGAELHLVPPALNLQPRKLCAWIRERELTQWFSVPSLLSYLRKFNVVGQDDFPSLRRMIWCGEVFQTPALMYWMQRLPHVSFTNLYGPTETTIASSYYTLPKCPGDAREAIPIGRACGGEELLVLDDEQQPVAPGEQGELYISGEGLATGYWNDHDKTSAAFIKRPAKPGNPERLYKTGDLCRQGEDGFVYFLGRLDDQVKCRGYRIELGEIEAALNQIPSIRETVVTARASNDFGNHTICCAYTTANGERVDTCRLRKDLAGLLPPYMLPSQWKALEEFPRNGNGKIDRAHIRELFSNDEISSHRQ